MDEIKNSSIRVGAFTGTGAHRLVGAGKRNMTAMELALRPAKGTGSATKTIEDPAILSDAAWTYIDEKNMERRLNRTLFDTANAKSLTWGKCVETRAFDILGMEYVLCSQSTRQHQNKDYPFWVGSPDAEKFDDGKTVCDIKCPITLKSFCNMVDPFYNGYAGKAWFDALRNGWIDKKGRKREPHDDGEKYYWQLINNAIITGAGFAELIIYCPYHAELDAIRQIAKFPDDMDSNKYNWIAYGSDDELPFLVDDGYYENINVLRFQIPEEDKDFLTKKVLQAAKELNGFAV